MVRHRCCGLRIRARGGSEAAAGKGAELETKDNNYGQTPLSWAARMGTRRW